MDNENEREKQEKLAHMLSIVFSGFASMYWKFREWLKANDITELSLSKKLGNHIQENDFVHIGEALRGTAVSYLDLSCNNLGAIQQESYIPPQTFFDIGKSFKGTSLTSINLSSNRLTVEAAIFFLKGVKIGRVKLEEINFSDNPIRA